MRIQCRNDYFVFREADIKSLGLEPRLKDYLFHDILKFQLSLRKLEYTLNCSRNLPLKMWRRWRHRNISRRLGFLIPPNVFGPGLAIAHRGTIIVNGGANIGSNCRIHTDVNIGTRAGAESAAPKIGDDCYIAPGAKIFGEVVIGNGSVIGANAVVNKSFPKGDQTIAGVPARVISNKGSNGLIFKGFLRAD